MSNTDHVKLEFRAVDAGLWPAVAEKASGWWRDQAIDARDAVLLLPFAELLPLAREAFAARGGWQPRIETTHTLARSLGPPTAHAAGSLSFDDATDRLAAAALLRGQAWASSLTKHDARGLDPAAASVVRCAGRWARHAATLPSHQREAFWEQARSRLAPLLSGPGAIERALARVALEWAAASEPIASDRLFDLQPAAWVLVRCGGPDRLADQVAMQRSVPTLVIDADPAMDAPFQGLAVLPPPRLLRCEGFEAEAQAAAGAVLQALQGGCRPVALIAQDRALVRRVRALLARSLRLRLHDETGWKLSTTRAAARVMALLRAARDAASRDTLLDWLKADAAAAPPHAALSELETAWRAHRAPSEAAARWWAPRLQRLQALQTTHPQALSAWLQALHRALFADAAAALSFAADPAGRQLLQALHLDPSDADAHGLVLAQDLLMDLRAFNDWVDGVLEASTFVPPRTADPDVVITPLSRALLRPFGAVVMPGADDRHLGAWPAPDPLLGDALAGALGLEDVAQQRTREALAFAHLLRMPQVTLLRRDGDGDEPLGASPLVERLLRSLKRAGAPVPQEQRAVPARRRVLRSPISRPAPRAVQGLPASLSASAVESLRECPYRFFAKAMLRLREPSELDAELAKRDYGSWLHAVLHRFHLQREQPQAAEVERARLLAIGDELQAELGIDAAQLLPYRCAFESLATHYVQWMHQRDAQGWRWHAGEAPLRAELPALAERGMALHGQLDRIDQNAEGVQLIDYKTGSVDELKRKVAAPLEDTQLAVYGALAEAAGLASGPHLQAMYLVLDERRAPQQVEHPQVAQTALLLQQGLAQDLAEIDAGAGLAALGEGPVCDYCEMRGLCRRDHWTSGRAA